MRSFAPVNREVNMILRLPTIFLDFDGVLHGESEVGSRPFNKLPLLEDALGKTDADFQIVISSSWRFHYTLEELRGCLASLKNYVVGVTPEIRPCSDMRYHEIIEVVHTHGIRKWIAIDDAIDQFPPGCPHLLRCDPSCGLRVDQAKFVRSWILRAE